MRRAPRLGLLLATLAALCLPRNAVAVISCGGKCWQEYFVDWGAGTLGPICMCPGGNSTAVFTWSGTDNHGVFQIPSDACPSNFTAWKTDTYQELAPASLTGQYLWRLPAQDGDYWVTSQVPNDCENGILVQFRVTSSGTRAGLQLAAAVGAAVLAVLTLGL